MGISYPWDVDKVALDLKKNRIDVWIQEVKGVIWKCPYCGARGPLHRLLRGFKRFTKPQPQRRGPKPVYDSPALLTAPKKIWLAANQPCASRLNALLLLWLPSYGHTFGERPPPLQQNLQMISPATLNRLRQPVRIQYNKRSGIGVGPENQLMKDWQKGIPAGMIDGRKAWRWEERTSQRKFRRP